MAVPREGTSPGYGYLGSWNRWSPSYYGSGLNWYYGYPYYSPFLSYSSYNPYLYNRWLWTRYGMWYDPYGGYGYYDPYYIDPWYGGYGYSGYGYTGYGYSGYGYGGSGSSSGAYSSSYARPAVEATGSIRVRVKPTDGKVYLDGTLVGTVDEFNGFTEHLAATVGAHELVIRADGYDPLTVLVNVEEEETVTARGKLKKAR